MTVKKSLFNRLLNILVWGVLTVGSQDVLSQGKVIINEFSNGLSLNKTQDFIELKNVGVGVADISGYMITIDNETIKLPKNTVLQEGGFYVVNSNKMIAKEKENVRIFLKDSASNIIDALSGSKADLQDSKVESLLDAAGQGNYFSKIGRAHV